MAQFVFLIRIKYANKGQLDWWLVNITKETETSMKFCLKFKNCCLYIFNVFIFKFSLLKCQLIFLRCPHAVIMMKVVIPSLICNLCYMAIHMMYCKVGWKIHKGHNNVCKSNSTTWMRWDYLISVYQSIQLPKPYELRVLCRYKTLWK